MASDAYPYGGSDFEPDAEAMLGSPPAADEAGFSRRDVLKHGVPLDRWREALEAAAYRTAITGIVTFT